MSNETATTRGLVLATLVIALGACAAQTRYAGIPVSELSDEQLVEELISAAEGLGIELNKAMHLMAVRPEPAYVLTSDSTTFAGTIGATYKAYSMPVGYGIQTFGRAIHRSGRSAIGQRT